MTEALPLSAGKNLIDVYSLRDWITLKAFFEILLLVLKDFTNSIFVRILYWLYSYEGYFRAIFTKQMNIGHNQTYEFIRKEIIFLWKQKLELEILSDEKADIDRKRFLLIRSDV